MVDRKLVVIEANEVPRRVLEAATDPRRTPALDRLLARADGLIETEIREELPREPYPSQTWASLSTGVPYADHQVWWYGEPKPAAYPLYWQAVARAGGSVGLVGTLHSSPLDDQCTDGEYRFAVPDCFGTDDATIPTSLGPVQRFNLAMTSRNSRTASLRLEGVDRDLVRSVLGAGIRPKTYARVTALLAAIAAGRAPRERLRVAQFMVLGDIFLHQMKQTGPDLGVLFTNHVASAMHRYWYALFPHDYAERHYDQSWVQRYRNEIPEAVRLLDRLLAQLVPWCERTDRTLVLVSSMGQQASPELDPTRERTAVIADAERFLRWLGIDSTFQVHGAMAPQLTLSLPDETRAARAFSTLGDPPLQASRWQVDRSDRTITITYRLDPPDDEHLKTIAGQVPARDLGVEIRSVDDHSSGRHMERGVLLVHNSQSWKRPAEPVVDYLEFAPALLEHMGMRRLDHHREPSFSL